MPGTIDFLATAEVLIKVDKIHRQPFHQFTFPEINMANFVLVELDRNVGRNLLQMVFGRVDKAIERRNNNHPVAEAPESFG